MQIVLIKVHYNNPNIDTNEILCFENKEIIAWTGSACVVNILLKLTAMHEVRTMFFGSRINAGLGEKDAARYMR